MNFKINYGQLVMVAAVSAAMIYASNRRVPIFGNGIRRAIG